MSKLNLGDSLILNSDIIEDVEIKTGATFKGKPVYCQCGKLTGTWTALSNEAINSAIANIKDVVYCEVNTFTLEASAFLPLPFIYSSASNAIEEYGSFYAESNGRIRINARRSAGLKNIIYRIYYTKTTD